MSANPDRKRCFLVNSVYSSKKTLQSDLDNVPFYLNNAEFNCHKSAREIFGCKNCKFDLFLSYVMCFF